MTSGYLSREIVNDMLAIKEGEKDFLKKQNIQLQQRIAVLEERLALVDSTGTS